MTLAIFLVAWLVLPVALWLILRRKTKHAVPLISIMIGIILLGVGQWMKATGLEVLTATTQSAARRAIQASVSHAVALQKLGFQFFFLTPILVTVTAFGRGLPPRLLPVAFGAYYLSCTPFVLQPALVMALNSGSIDHSQFIRWLPAITSSIEILRNIGIGLLLLLAVIAFVQAVIRLTQTLVRRKT
ncbi:hypothetical protein [Cypionkella sp. TWP1-2-1b2]|uniref:hypothetical protein n=1 Tax=Cypionkella sp. TWP1-2-1b2 TaxID=2804675 RepID=UPI003CEEBD6D